MRYQGWKAVLVAGLVMTVIYFRLPGDGAKDMLYLGVGLTASVGIVFGAQRCPIGTRSGWYLLATANSCFAIGDGVSDIYGLILHVSVPLPSAADALYLAGYPFLFAGVARVSRPSRPTDSRANHTDAAIVCVGALALSWQLLMSSYVHDNTLSIAGKLVAMAYPMMDLGVLFILASAFLAGGARRSNDRLLLLSVSAMLIADFVYDLLSLHDSYATGNAIDAAFLINYIVLAAAALHPSAAQPVADPDEFRAQRRGWLPLVATAGSVSPAILLVSSLDGMSVDVAVLAATSLVLFALVITRMSFLFTRLRSQADVLAERGRLLATALSTQQDLEADLRHQAFHDPLTGLPNRALLHDRLDHALGQSRRSTGTVVLCFCDLDGFKAVNDTLGHLAGDELLILISERLTSVMRSGDTVARLGGDEFAVVLDNVTDTGAVGEVVNRIVAAVRQPARVCGEDVLVSVSVGVAFAEPGTDTERLLSEADSAMYEAKTGGKDRFAFFQPATRSRLQTELTLRKSFPTALPNSEFFLEYQPQISLADGRLEGFEALVRWRHPTLGRLAPDHFIPLAEETGFVVPLSRWILEAACVEAAGWQGRAGGDISLSVNVSGRQLEHPHLPQDVHNALAYSGLPPERLVLEITETVLMQNPAAAVDILAQLRALGIQIAIDDFGTGYSSLGQLRHLPVDILKIDKCFVDALTDPSGDDLTMIEAILRLAHDLDLRTVAEGVENLRQQQTLATLDCHSAQGYLFARPLSADAAGEFIVDGSGRVPALRSGPRP